MGLVKWDASDGNTKKVSAFFSIAILTNKQRSQKSASRHQITFQGSAKKTSKNRSQQTSRSNNTAIHSMPILPGWLVWALVGVAGSSAAVQLNKDNINLFFMRVFRDIGRHKAYKRRYGGNEYALSTFLLQKDDPLLGVAEDRVDDLPSYSVEELWEMGNVEDFEDAEDGEPRQLLLSIFGRIYDVTKGTKFYGTYLFFEYSPKVIAINWITAWHICL